MVMMVKIKDKPWRRRKKFFCGLCGNIRRVRTYPRSDCSCKENLKGFAYMHTPLKIYRLLRYTKQKIKLLYTPEWKHDHS